MGDSNTMTFVGLDVHKDSIVVAVAEEGRSPARAVATVPFEFNALRKVLERLGPKAALRCCYEAGPTGYGLARAVQRRGWACDVIAPSLIPKKPGERIKTDRRDAAKLATNLRAGELVAVAIPDEACEAIRDLERARDDAVKAERVARPGCRSSSCGTAAATRARRPGRRRTGPGSPARCSPRAYAPEFSGIWANTLNK